MSITIILVILIIIIGLYFFVTSKNNKEIEEINETQKIAEEIKAKLNKGKINNQKDLMNGQGVSKNGGGIINNNASKQANKSKSLKTETDKKPNAWKETSSYDEDVKTVDLDTLLKPVVKPNADIKVNIDIKDNKPEEEKQIKFTNPLILLVDDSMVVRKYVGDLLKKSNYDIVLKNDGWEAITYLNSNSQNSMSYWRRPPP